MNTSSCSQKIQQAKNTEIQCVANGITVDRSEELSYNASKSTTTTQRENKDAVKSHEARWQEMFNRLLDFKEKHGHCLVPNRYPEDPKLGTWVATQRRQYKVVLSGGRGKTCMTPERASKLEQVGFNWSPKEEDTKKNLSLHATSEYPNNLLAGMGLMFDPQHAYGGSRFGNNIMNLSPLATSFGTAATDMNRSLANTNITSRLLAARENPLFSRRYAIESAIRRKLVTPLAHDPIAAHAGISGVGGGVVPRAEVFRKIPQKLCRKVSITDDCGALAVSRRLQSQQLSLVSLKGYDSSAKTSSIPPSCTSNRPTTLPTSLQNNDKTQVQELERLRTSVKQLIQNISTPTNGSPLMESALLRKRKVVFPEIVSKKALLKASSGGKRRKISF